MQNRSGRGGEVHSIVVKLLYGRGCGNAYRSDRPCEPSSSPHDEPAVALGQLTTACLFAVVGGYMDAYCYLAHGQVFANTQTGNFVLFSLYASQGHWSQAVRHLPPILACSLGVVVASGLNVHAKSKTWQVPLLCQALELAILAVLAAVGARLPDASVVPLISFVAALQYTSFNRVGPWSFSSAMNTGNLRDATSGWVLWSAGRETTANRRKAVILSLICFSFVIGALCGSSYTRRNLAHALWPCVAIVAAGFLLTYRERSKAARASTGTW
jgi:uncharacterized membrane protein YoaK (UPF0700 family)